MCSFNAQHISLAGLLSSDLFQFANWNITVTVVESGKS